jgi:hypothetical protein
MEIREITSYNEKSPFQGYGVWMVMTEENRRAHLLHPVCLTEMYLREYEYRKSVGDCLWPNKTSKGSFNRDKFSQKFRERITTFVQLNKPFPVNTVARALSELDSISLEEAMRFVGQVSVNEYGESISKLTNKANREYDIKKGIDPEDFRGRQRALLLAFKEHGPASIYQITSMVDGKLKTKSDLSRVVVYFVNKLASQGILEIVA